MDTRGATVEVKVQRSVSRWLVQQDDVRTGSGGDRDKIGKNQTQDGCGQSTVVRWEAQGESSYVSFEEEATIDAHQRAVDPSGGAGNLLVSAGGGY